MREYSVNTPEGKTYVAQAALLARADRRARALAFAVARAAAATAAAHNWEAHDFCERAKTHGVALFDQEYEQAQGAGGQ